jgi:hypothetical protein
VLFASDPGSKIVVDFIPGDFSILWTKVLFKLARVLTGILLCFFLDIWNPIFRRNLLRRCLFHRLHRPTFSQE